MTKGRGPFERNLTGLDYLETSILQFDQNSPKFTHSWVFLSTTKLYQLLDSLGG